MSTITDDSTLTPGDMEMLQQRGQYDTPPPGNKQPLIIDNNIAVSVGLVVSVIVGAVGGAWMIRGALNDVDGRLKSIEKQLNDRWTVQNMMEWREELKDKNPTMTLPSIGEIRRGGPSDPIR